MSRNKSWTSNRRGGHGFNPVGRPGFKRPQNFQDQQNQPPLKKPIAQFDKMSKNLLMLYLEKKWNEEARMLDLENLVNAEELAELSPNFNHFGFCSKLAQCVAEGKKWSQKLDSINFSHNNIRYLRHLSNCLVDQDVKLLNLAFGSNQISVLDEVDTLGGLNLREVVLANNPIARNANEYHMYVVKKLKSLQLLDGVSVREWRKELLPKLPEPLDSQFTTEANQACVTQMCVLYFKCIDGRLFDDLVDAYDNDSGFSYTTEQSNKVYPHPSSKDFHTTLFNRSHNLNTPYILKNSTRNVFRGRTAIVEFHKRLYSRIKTTHDVSLFKADAIMLAETIVATIHGIMQYKVDGDRNSYTKCFDRVFVLRPNKAGTAWPARIANDTITFRAEEPTPMLLPEVDLKSKLMAETGLVGGFVEILMREANQDYAKAMELFVQSKASGAIPAEAFAKP